MRKYIEVIVAAIGAGVIAAVGFLTDGFTTTEKLMTLVAVFGAAATWLTTNTDVPWWNQTKAIVFGLHAGLLTAVAAIASDGISAGEWWQIVAAVVTAAGIYKAPSYVSAVSLDSPDLSFPPPPRPAR
jgi:hypothetical protein